MISKLIIEMHREMRILMKRLLWLFFWTVERAYTITKETPTITIVAKMVIMNLKNFWVLVRPKFPQLISSGYGG